VLIVVVVAEEGGRDAIFLEYCRECGYVRILSLPGLDCSERRMMGHHESIVGFLM